MSEPGKLRFISTDRRVREDRRFVVGKGNFAADIVPQGVKHVALVTCPYPAARIVSIDKSAALAMPGVHYVLEGAELAAATLPLATGLDTPNVPRRPLALMRIERQASKAGTIRVHKRLRSRQQQGIRPSYRTVR